MANFSKSAMKKEYGCIEQQRKISLWRGTPLTSNALFPLGCDTPCLAILIAHASAVLILGFAANLAGIA